MDIPELDLVKIKENRMCFGCGKDNPLSMKLDPYLEGEIAEAKCTPNEFHQGWSGYAHGGVLMTILDEIISYLCYYSNFYVVTAKIDFRIRSMAKIGEPLIAMARILKLSKRLPGIQADLKRNDGTIIAEALSVQFVVK
ncbi:PaaI family thioesterase [Chloroflexota bacterium]